MDDEDFDITDIDKSELTYFPEENQENFHNIEFHDGKKSYKTEKKEEEFGIKCDICSKKFRTGKSFSEALILASTNPKHDKKFFIDLPVQYMKTTCSEHVVYINCF